jgi:NlpC/P60 family putative phage cell wall peptidase
MSPADIVSAARSWLGTPYHHQAALKGVGCDCLGLVRGVYEELYGKPAEAPPPYSRDWAEAAAIETMLEAARRHLTEIGPGEARLGDAVIFRFRRGAMAKHAGIISSWPDIRPGLAHLAVGPAEGASSEMTHASASDIRPGLAHLAVSPAEGASSEKIQAAAPDIHPGSARLGVVGADAAAWKMIHAMEGAPACEVHLNSWWRRRIAAAFRFPERSSHVQPLPKP